MQFRNLFVFKKNKNTSLFQVLVFLITIFFPIAASALTISPVRMELSGNPGDVASGNIKAINPDAASKTYFTNVATFEAIDESGNPTFRIVKSDLASWIKIDSAITLGPNETKSVPFSINIPATAEPGGYFAAIFLTANPPAESQSQVSLSSQVGSLVLFRVNGNIQEGADILEFDAKNHQHWFTSLPINFYFRFQNSGQSWVKPLGDMVVQNFFHQTKIIFPANKNEGNVLPQSIRRFENSWTGRDGLTTPSSKFWPMVWYELRNFALGPYTVHLNLAYGGNSLQGATASTTVWVFPWQLLLILIIGGIALFYILRFFIKRYNRYIISSAQPASRNRRSK